jgi:hypothetical protein
VRHGAQRSGLKEALKAHPELREEFWKNVNVTGEGGELNQSLEYAGAWRTSWSSPNCSASTRCIAANRAAAISARNSRRRTARPARR